jgi:hypothetical protein
LLKNVTSFEASLLLLKRFVKKKPPVKGGCAITCKNYFLIISFQKARGVGNRSLLILSKQALPLQVLATPRVSPTLRKRGRPVLFFPALSLGLHVGQSIG